MAMSFRRKLTLPVIFFSVYLILGLSIVDDYGISWDEPLQRNHGLVSMDYINELSGMRLYSGRLSQDTWAGYSYKDHGVIFQLTCIGIEKLLGVRGDRDIFLIRHVMGFLIHFGGCIALFAVFRMRSSRYLALGATLVFILTPRIFGHSFFNPKDIIALGWYNLCLYTAMRFLESPNSRTASMHAAATALMINSRLFGVYVIAATSGLFVVLAFLQGRSDIRRWKWKSLLLYLGLSILLVHLIWPNMWEDPLNNLYYGLRRVSKYHWLGDILFDGHWVPAQQIPWYYLPIWMGITVPAGYLFLSLTGMLNRVMGITKGIFRKQFGRMDTLDLTIAVFCIGPALAVILKESVMYDGWRHLYFIYGGIVYFTLCGYQFLEKRMSGIRFTQNLLRTTMFLYLIWNALIMMRIHPFQQAYFNEMVQKPIDGRFEADYWGTSFKQLLEELHWRYPDEQLLLYSNSDPLEFNYKACPASVQEHILLRRTQDFPPGGEYVFCTVFRGKYDQYLWQNRPELFREPLAEIYVQGNLIAGAYRISR